MTARRLAYGLIAIFALVAGFLSSSRSSDAHLFRPSAPSPIYSTLALNANPNSDTFFNIGAPDSNFFGTGAVAYTDDSFTIAAGSAITEGRTVGYVNSSVSLGLLSQECPTGGAQITVDIRMRNGDTSMTDVIVPGGPPAGTGRLANMAEDNRGPDPGEAIVVSADGNFTTGEAVLLAQADPANNTAVINFDAVEKYVDANSDSRYTIGESIYREGAGPTGVVDPTDTFKYGAMLGGASIYFPGTTLTAFDADEKHADGGAPSGNVATDWDGMQIGADTLQDHLNATPKYVRSVAARADGTGVVTPLARYSGHQNVAGLDVILELVVFNAGALTVLPNGEHAIAALGKPSFTVLQDPDSAPSKTITDFCTPLSSTTRLCGRTDTNPDLFGFGDCDDVGGDPEGPSQLRLTSPGAARTVQTTLQSTSFRDYDNDGHENSLESCAFTDSATWNPRIVSNASNFDSDTDGLSNDCDPGGGGGDPDADQWGARIDNCPLSKNGDTLLNANFTADGDTLNDTISVDTGGDTTAGFVDGDEIKISEGIVGVEEVRTLISHTGTTMTVADLNNSHFSGEAVTNNYRKPNVGQFDQDVAFPGSTADGGPRSESLGPECDPSPGTIGVGGGTPNGHFHRQTPLARNCIGGTDADGDGVCAAGAGLIDPNDANTDVDSDGVSDRLDDCISVSNPAVPGYTQADSDMDGQGDNCDTDDDDDGTLDGADGDVDGDGVLNGADNCPDAGGAGGVFNPDQANLDGDALGDACDTDMDGDGTANAVEINAGVTNFERCAANAGADNEGLDARVTDFNDDQSVTGFDQDQVAGAIGTNPGPGSRKDIGDGNGSITGFDLDKVRGEIGTTCTPIP